MRWARSGTVLVVCGLLSACSAEAKARRAVAKLFSEDADDDHLREVVRQGAPCVPFLVHRMARDMGNVPRYAMQAMQGIGSAAAPALRDELDSPDPSHRIVALHFLLWTPRQPPGNATMRRCAECLVDGDEIVRRLAAIGLARRGSRSPKLIPVLLSELRNSEGHGVFTAQFLHGFGHSVGAIVTELLTFADDPNRFARRQVRRSLTSYWVDDPRVPVEWERWMSSGERQDKVECLRALTIIPSPQAAVAHACIDAMADESTAVRRVASKTLLSVWRKWAPSRSDQLAALRHELAPVRAAACRAVEFSRGLGVPDVGPLLNDRSSVVREAAASALGALSREDPTALAILSKAVADHPVLEDIVIGEPGIDAAAWVLVEHGHDVVSAMEHLVGHGYAVELVKRYGPAANPSAGALERLLRESEDRDVAWALFVATGDASKSFAVLRPMLRDDGGYQAMQTCVHVARYGKSAAPLVPDLRALLADPHWETRRHAATALGYVGPAARSAIPDLIALLDDHEHAHRGRKYSVSRSAAAALALLDVDSPKVNRLLTAVLEEYYGDDGNTRPGAFRHAWKRGLRSPKEVAELCAKSLHSSEWTDALPILRLLEEMGPAAEAAIPALEKQLHKRWELRTAAERALATVRVR